jgi:hypothetical protein
MGGLSGFAVIVLILIFFGFLMWGDPAKTLGIVGGFVALAIGGFFIAKGISNKF